MSIKPPAILARELSPRRNTTAARQRRRTRRRAAAPLLDRSRQRLRPSPGRPGQPPVRRQRGRPRALAGHDPRARRPAAGRPRRALQRQALPVLPAREDPRHAAEPAAQVLPVAAERPPAVGDQGALPDLRQRHGAVQRDAGDHAHGDLHVRLHRVGRGRLQGPRAAARDLLAPAEPDLDQPREPHRRPRGRAAVRRVPGLELQLGHGRDRRDARAPGRLPGRGARQPQRLRRHLPVAARLVRQAEQPRRRGALVRRLHGRGLRGRAREGARGVPRAHRRRARGLRVPRIALQPARLRARRAGHLPRRARGRARR